MLKRLRIRFVCINMAIVTIMLVIIMGTILQMTRHNIEQTGLQTMHSLSMFVHQPLPPDGREFPTRQHYFTLRANGRGSWNIAGDPAVFDPEDQHLIDTLANDTIATGEHAGVLQDYKLRYQHVFTPAGHYLVYTDASGEINTINSLLRSCLLIGLGAFFSFLVISLFLARWAVRPVETAWNQQQQFVADASHELKTPLAVIMTSTELLRSVECSPQQRIQYISNIAAVSEKMRTLVESLLELARIDNGTVNASLSVLNLSELICTAALPFEALYFERGLTLDCQIQQNLLLRGDAAKLSDVIGILLDNAQKYSYPCTQVILTLQAHGRSHCLLRISNAGDPIAPADLKNIFKRFYRVDKARSNTHSYGLGLSIAEGIVQLHHGRIWAESADGINTFCVLFPTVQAN